MVSFAGAQEALFALSHALLPAGETLAVLTPAFQPLVHTFAERGCRVKTVPLQPEQGWAMDWNRLETVLQQGCRLLIINYPHNPTGTLLTRAELEQLVALCDHHGCRILSDEVFRGLEHEPETRLPALCDLHEQAVSVGVFSKAYALPALRIGWVASRDKQLIQRLQVIRGQISICNSLLDEQLAVRVLAQSEAILQYNRRRIRRNWKALQAWMESHTDTLHCLPPAAGCCAFPCFRDGRDAEGQAEQWIQQQGRMVLPGRLFLGPSSGFRVGFGFDDHMRYYPEI